MYAVIEIATGKLIGFVSSKREADFLAYRSNGVYETVQV